MRVHDFRNRFLRFFTFFFVVLPVELVLQCFKFHVQLQDASSTCILFGPVRVAETLYLVWNRPRALFAVPALFLAASFCAA